MSGFADAIALDSRMLDMPQTVTLTQQPAGTTRTVTDCQRYEISRREVQASEGLFTSQDEVWEVPQATACWSAAVLTPDEGDTITDSDSVVWSIIDVQRTVWDTLFRCVTRRQR